MSDQEIGRLIHVALAVDDDSACALTLGDSDNASLSIGGTLYEITPIPYEGAYEVTPTRYEQVLHTESKNMLHDVIINPIPSNYGLITYNGSVITVS